MSGERETGRKKDRHANRPTPAHVNKIQTQKDILLTLVVLTLLPVLQDQPVRSGRTLHSSPSIHGCIWHHHFWATMEAGAVNAGLEEEKDCRLLNGYYDMMKSTELITKKHNSVVFTTHTHQPLPTQ